MICFAIFVLRITTLTTVRTSLVDIAWSCIQVIMHNKDDQSLKFVFYLMILINALDSSHHVDFDHVKYRLCY